MPGIKINPVTKEKLSELKHNISMLQSLSKDMLIGIILGINEREQQLK